MSTITAADMDTKFRRMLTLVRVACEAVGVQSRQITIRSKDQIELEDFGITVTRTDGKANGAPAKVWVVKEKYKIFALMRKPREVEEDVLSTPIDDMDSVAKSVATVCARQMIELAIDAELS